MKVKFLTFIMKNVFVLKVVFRQRVSFRGILCINKVSQLGNCEIKTCCDHVYCYDGRLDCQRGEKGV